MTIERSPGLRSYTYTDGVNNAFDGYVIYVLTGTRPAPAAAHPGTVLLRLPLQSPALGAFDPATARAPFLLTAAQGNVLSEASGAAGYAIIAAADDDLTQTAGPTVRRATKSVGVTGSGADLTLPSLTVANNTAYTVSSPYWQEPT